METLDQLLSKLERSGVLRTPQIKEAFKRIDRKDFVKPEYKDFAYEDKPFPIGGGQTISQPTTVAFMLERLQPVKGDRVLDVGSGSGWTTALLSFLVDGDGEVIGLERINELVKFGQVNLKKYGFDQAEIRQADDDKLGYLQKAPYDKILVSAAAQEVPQQLVDQLKEGGVMVIPVKSSLFKITKQSQDYQKEEYYGFSFVPLVEEGENSIEENYSV